jgi:hypothetical protein
MSTVGRFALRRLYARIRPRRVEAARTHEAQECERFLRDYERAYAGLRADPQAWAEVEAERRAWDGTLLDGLEPEQGRA